MKINRSDYITRKSLRYKHYWIIFRYSSIMNKYLFYSKLIKGYIIHWLGFSIIINWMRDEDRKKEMENLNLGEKPTHTQTQAP